MSRIGLLLGRMMSSPEPGNQWTQIRISSNSTFNVQLVQPGRKQLPGTTYSPMSKKYISLVHSEYGFYCVNCFLAEQDCKFVVRGLKKQHNVMPHLLLSYYKHSSFLPCVNFVKEFGQESLKLSFMKYFCSLTWKIPVGVMMRISQSGWGFALNRTWFAE